MTENLLYVYLSGVHKTLPKAEVLAIAEAENISTRIVLDLDQLLVLYTNSELAGFLRYRAAYSRRVGKVLWIGRIESIKDGVLKAAEQLHYHGVGSVRIEYRELGGREKTKNYENVVRLFAESGIRLDKLSENVVDAITSQEVVVIGLRAFEIRLKDFFARWTSRRPTYLPGALNPDISRLFVNLSRASIRKGAVFYDPFCGVGSFLLEACFMGLRYAGSDIDARRLVGASKNLRNYGCEPEVFLADACRIPVYEVDAIGTDMPYGRQTKPLETSIKQLVSCLLENSESILRKGSYLVFAQSSELEDDAYRYIDKHDFELVEVHRNWIHGSLTRNIYVLKRR